MSTPPAGWVSEPDGRGTWGLIQSCLVTLCLCIYTAIHLNIRPQQTESQSWLRRIKASLLASVAPEFMFVCAISQWNVAKQLQKQLNSIDSHVSVTPVWHHLVDKLSSLKASFQTEQQWEVVT